MRAAWLICGACILIISCKHKDKIPEGVLPKEKMQAVLGDIMRADQFLVDFVFSKDTSINKEKESVKFYQQVFSIHKVSKEEFQKSFAFYRSHPQLLKNIMDSIGHRPVDPPPATTAQPDTTKKKFTAPLKMN